MRFSPLAAAVVSIPLAFGCGGGAPTDPVGTSGDALTAAQRDGKMLFMKDTFHGNGRTCQTCHSAETGTLNPEEITQLYQDDPGNALFRSLDSDDGVGDSYQRLMREATVRIAIPLPPNITLLDDPGARSVTVERGIPSTLDTPALDNVFMLDGRQPTLESQALGALHDHAQNTVDPTSTELADIADFEKTLFSQGRTRQAYGDGTTPEFPHGTTASEKRGEAFFQPGGSCGICHAQNLTELPPQTRFTSIGVSEINFAGKPVHRFLVTNPDGSQTEVDSPDPGRMLVTGNVNDNGAFKIPLLWNVKNTAPYFHDNSAATLDDVMNFYAFVFPFVGLPPLSQQDIQDIKAYMMLF